MNPDLPSPPDRSKAVIIFIAAVVAAAAIGYVGYQKVAQWHEKEIKAAVSQQQQEMAKTKAEMEARIQELQKQPPAPPAAKPEASPAVSDERLTEVFGSQPVDKTAESESEPTCDALNRRISAFLDYLRKKAKPAAGSEEAFSSDWMAKMLHDLSASPPLVADETRNMESLKRNESHFFKVLKKDRIRMVKTILMMDKDLLEHALADGYQYYVSTRCCKPGDPACVSLKTLYEYAGFFMATFSGKSYLLRRDSTIRCLTDYYCVLILDQANDAELNPYGIDIRPQIDLALDAVSHQNNLIFKGQYMDALNRLKTKYALKTQPAAPETTDDGKS
ncbi:MAG: hypothetical protein M0Z56_05220 [Desulfobacteraceae bacterium]|nr:hypothetical protein [Desulfobacteraceae bacterium]